MGATIRPSGSSVGRRLAEGRAGWWLALSTGLVAIALPAQVVESNSLRTASAVRGLTFEEAQQKVPVHLRGVVTFFDARLYSRFIQDDTAGIYLYDFGFPTNYTPGQVLEVDGTSGPGEYAPIVIPSRVRLLGRAPLPAPKLVNYQQLASGAEDSQFVQISGIVRSVEFLPGPEQYLIQLATGGGRLSVYARRLPVADTAELLDSTLRVRGVCSTQFNHQRQLFAIRLLVPRPEDLVVETPAPRDPFGVPARPISSLLQFAPQETYGHRVKVEGTVTYFKPGQELFLQQGVHGIQVLTTQRSRLRLGDRVEALGFVSQGDYTPVLQDAVYRKIAPGPPLAPTPVTPDEALKGMHDSRLIRVEGKLLDRAVQGGGIHLILQDGQIVFEASLKKPDAAGVFSRLANGSRLAVTGICQIDPGEWLAGEDWRAKSFRVLLQSAGDAVLLVAPPWWTAKKVLWMAGALGLTALAAFGWVGVLRRQVAQRTQELELQIQQRQRAERRREIEQERARMAHDLHDDLGAGLTEVNMLTTLAKSPATSAPEKERYLSELSETARRMVTSLDELVWTVNPRNDTIASLASYFASYAQRLLDLASISCGLDVAEDLPPYPLGPKFRQELFFAFKEALTNVVRHALARQVWLRIAVTDGHLAIEVCDDGRGLVPSQPAPGADGLANMSERLKSLGGSCEILSGPGKGTTVRFQAPLPPKVL